MSRARTAPVCGPGGSRRITIGTRLLEHIARSPPSAQPVGKRAQTCLRSPVTVQPRSRVRWATMRRPMPPSAGSRPTASAGAQCGSPSLTSSSSPPPFERRAPAPVPDRAEDRWRPVRPRQSRAHRGLLRLCHSPRVRHAPRPAAALARSVVRPAGRSRLRSGVPWSQDTAVVARSPGPSTRSGRGAFQRRCPAVGSSNRPRSSACTACSAATAGCSYTGSTSGSSPATATWTYQDPPPGWPSATNQWGTDSR